MKHAAAHKRASAFRARVGHRGAVLLFFAVLDFAYAGSLFLPSPDDANSAALVFAGRVLPLTHWAALWSACGVIVLVGAFRRRDGVAFAAAVAMKTLWGGLFLLGWIMSGLSRGWLFAVVWLGAALMLGVLSTWPEPSRGAK